MTDQSNVFSTTQQAAPAPTPEGQQAASAQPVPTEQVQPQSGNAFSDQLMNIKTEDGRQKYDTVEKALEALAHSQTHIPSLQGKLTDSETELTKLREELAKREGVQEVYDKLTQHQQQVKDEGNPSDIPLGEDAIAQMIEATLNKRTEAQTSTSNSQKVNDALVSSYGDKASAVVQSKAKELNITPEELGVLAAKSPDMVLALFTNSNTSTSLTTGSYNKGFSTPEDKPLGRPEKSLLSGSTTQAQLDYMKLIKEQVYKKYNVTE